MRDANPRRAEIRGLAEVLRKIRSDDLALLVGNFGAIGDHRIDDLFPFRLVVFLAGEIIGVVAGRASLHDDVLARAIRQVLSDRARRGRSHDEADRKNAEADWSTSFHPGIFSQQATCGKAR